MWTVIGLLVDIYIPDVIILVKSETAWRCRVSRF
jgi:hypothetical protein